MENDTNTISLNFTSIGSVKEAKRIVENISKDLDKLLELLEQ